MKKKSRCGTDVWVQMIILKREKTNNKKWSDPQLAKRNLLSNLPEQQAMVWAI